MGAILICTYLWIIGAGEVILQGHLRSRGIHVRRKHLRESIHRVDPEGTKERRRPCIKRRVYSVPCPNYLWHADGNHKLIRWRFVVHCAIDGFSRLVTFLKASDNNCSQTVLGLFNEASSTYGFPMRLRTDYGGENVLMWRRMYEKWGVERKPVIVGSSVHNERVERFNREINKSCEMKYKPIFYDLEQNGLLDPDNESDLFCLHYVFLPRMNETLEQFRLAHNNHSLSTEKNQTPVQLFYGNLNLLGLQDGCQDDDPYNGCTPEILLQREQPHVSVPTTNSPLNNEQLAMLFGYVHPLHGDGVDTFKKVVQFVGQCVLR